MKRPAKFRTRTVVGLIAAPAALAAMVAAAIFAGRADDSLLARAARLPVAPGDAARLSLHGARWCETGELFAWTNGGVARINLATGGARPVVAGGGPVGLAQTFPQGWKVTPDGRWIIYQRWRRGGGANGSVLLLSRVAVQVDGTARFALPQRKPFVPNVFDMVWLRDVNSWREAYASQPFESKLSVSTRVVTAPGRPERVIALGPTPKSRWNQGLTFLGRTARGTLLFSIHIYEGVSGDKDFWEYTLGPPGTRAQSQRHFKPRLPVSHACVIGLVLSPRGDRLAWRIHESGRGSWLPGFLQDVLVRLSRWEWIPRERPSVGLWVSNVDGSNMRLIGRERTTSQTPRGFDGLCWSPNGTRLLFRLDDRLYTVSAKK